MRCLTLRPHHLLCTQGYSGKGYDETFIQSMTEITNALRGEKPILINLVCSTDDICASCPLQISEDLCIDQLKVKAFDEKVMSYFNLETKTYNYKELIKEIDLKMTEEMMEDICGDCSWYLMSACKKNILEKRYV